MYAAYNGKYDAVNHLTFRTKNLDFEDIHGNTLMMILLKANNQDMVTKLVNRGANLNFRNKYGKSPLLFAVEN